MKKFLCIIPIILLLLCSCGNIPDDWNTVLIEDLGEIKIPGGWVVSKITSDTGNQMFFADKSIDENCNIYAIGMYYINSAEYESSPAVFKSEYTGEVRLDLSEDSTNVELYSNSATIETNLCYVNGEEQQLRCVSLKNLDEDSNPTDYIIIFLDKTVDDATVKAIAQSYLHDD